MLFVFNPSVSLYHQPLLSQEGFFTLDFDSQHFNFPPRHHSRDWDFLVMLHTVGTVSSRKQWSYIAPLEVSVQYKPCWLLPKTCFETFSIHLENAQVTAICPLTLAMDFLPCEQVWTKEKEEKLGLCHRRPELRNGALDALPGWTRGHLCHRLAPPLESITYYLYSGTLTCSSDNSPCLKSLWWGLNEMQWQVLAPFYDVSCYCCC